MTKQLTANQQRKAEFDAHIAECSGCDTSMTAWAMALDPRCTRCGIAVEHQGSYCKECGRERNQLQAMGDEALRLGRY